MGSLIRPGLQQGPLVWDPDLEEAGELPHSILLIDNYFTIYRRRRRALISGVAPPGLGGNRPPQARAWRAYQNRMNEEPMWKCAERYRQMMHEKGYHSIRALARATGADHSRLARILKVLELPEGVLAELRNHASHSHVRAHFTEKRLRQLVRENRSERAILREITQIVQGSTCLSRFAQKKQYCGAGTTLAE
ncbi:MAG: hypothetical protein COV75_02795 [Candidatus Omnitrophica bacterium CG11_big_fil_rev_8_21_14_0_20_63_9]|nr:MAG: hypothetical protein COV75_02795 [Candidatus Omnitrophica bacterium CG11_big_fil_rev_8_21_14_0_20_63_9]